MEESEIIIKAKRFCEIAHADQKRKYTGEPYFTHPLTVYRILRAHKVFDDNVLCAAILHDTIEDTKVTYEDIELFFNKRIADLVFEVTDISKPEDGNRKRRKEIDLEHLSKASYWGQTIKLADLLHNTSSILKADEDFAKVYMKEKKALLSVLIGGNTTLWCKASDIVDNYYRDN